MRFRILYFITIPILSALMTGCLTIKEREAIKEQDEIYQEIDSFRPDQILYRYDDNRYLKLVESSSCTTGEVLLVNNTKNIIRNLSLRSMNYKGVFISNSMDPDLIVIPGANSYSRCNKSCAYSSILYSVNGGLTFNGILWGGDSSHPPDMSRGLTVILDQNQLYIIQRDSYCTNCNKGINYIVYEMTIDKNLPIPIEYDQTQPKYYSTYNISRLDSYEFGPLFTKNHKKYDLIYYPDLDSYYLDASSSLSQKHINSIVNHENENGYAICK